MTQTDRPGPPLLAIAPAALFLLVLPLNHTMAVRLTALFLCGLVALYEARRHLTPAFPAKLPLALWAGLALISVSWSADPSFSFREFKAEIGYGMIAFASFFVLARNPARWGTVLAAALLGVLTTLLIAVAHFVTSAPGAAYEWDWQHGVISYSTYLATIAPLIIYVSLRPWPQRWVRPTVLLLFLLLLLVAYKTGNRMFWVSLGGSALLLAGLVWRKLPDRRQARAIALAAVGGLALVAAVFVMVAQQRLVDPLQPSQPATESALAHAAATLTQSERFEIWRFWIERIQEKPWTGVGFGRDLPHMVYQKPAEWFDLMFAHAHNLVLDYALQLGIPGAVLLLVVLGALAREFLRLYRAPQQEVWMLGACGLAVLLAMVSKNMTDDLFWRTDALQFWALMGMLLGFGSHQLQQQAPTPMEPHR